MSSLDRASEPVAPRPAATVILLRRQESGIELLMVRRSEQLRFMAGLWVFPGGAVDAADASAAALAHVPGSALERLPQFLDSQGRALDREQCAAVLVAAHRETFEETGVLLARLADGTHCGNDLSSRLQEQRSSSHEAARFLQMIDRHGLRLEVERLHYWAHWITPSAVPRRFDTRFFVIALPPEQVARIDATEAVDHAWLTPRAALAAHDAGRMPMSHPTQYTLLELQDAIDTHGDLDAFLDAARGRAISPVLPKILAGAPTTIVLPWDPEYASVPGEGVDERFDYTAQRRCMPSRAELRQPAVRGAPA